MKRNIQRMFASFLSIVLTLSLCPWALADYPADTRTGVEGEYAGKTVILHSNDVHGEIMGYAYIAALRTEFQNKGADVILADAGDFSQGDPTVSLSKGADAVAMMNAAGYDVATLGNHEFDFGYAQLMENLQAAEFSVICADVFQGDSSILPPTWTYEKDGLKIGFFGMETPETQTKVNPGLIQGIRFLSKRDIYVCAQEQIDALRADGADVVIALAHLGVDAESAPDGHRSVDMYANTTGIDLILDGHSHTVMTAGENGEPVQSTGTKFANVGVVVIDNATEKIEDHYLLSTEGMEQDEAVAEKAQEIIDRVNEEYGEEFAYSDILLNGERAPGNRTQETNLGDLITDAIVWKVLQVNREGDHPATLTVGDTTVDENHIVGVTNGGGIRASIEPGYVTRKDLNTVLPFGNTVAVVFVTGAELLEALEASTYATPEALGGYPQTFGIEFTLDVGKPYAQGDAYPESTYYSPASIERVTITQINGEPFDPAATYAVVTNNFCAAGGDTYYVFKNASAQFDTGIVMDEAVMEYVSDALDGFISEETYGEPRGDQTIFQSVAVPGETGVSLAETFASAPTDGLNVRITLSADTSLSETVRLRDGQNVTLDLAGRTLTAAEGGGIAVDGGTLTVTNSGNGGGIQSGGGADALITQSGGRVDVTDVALQTVDRACVRVAAPAEPSGDECPQLNLTNAHLETEFHAANPESVAALVAEGEAEVVISGGNILVTNGAGVSLRESGGVPSLTARVAVIRSTVENGAATGIRAEGATVQLSGNSVVEAEGASSTALYYSDSQSDSAWSWLGVTDGSVLKATASGDACALRVNSGIASIVDAEITAEAAGNAVGVWVDSGVALIDKDRAETKVTATSESGAADAVRIMTNSANENGAAASISDGVFIGNLSAFRDGQPTTDEVFYLRGGSYSVRPNDKFLARLKADDGTLYEIVRIAETQTATGATLYKVEDIGNAHSFVYSYQYEGPGNAYGSWNGAEEKAAGMTVTLRVEDAAEDASGQWTWDGGELEIVGGGVNLPFISFIMPDRDLTMEGNFVKKGEYYGKTVILHSNDVHGEIMGYAYIAALRTAFLEKDANVILADVGDFSQGDPTVSLSKGADAIAMMNAAGYDVATLGNHEFDFGYEQLMENLNMVNFPVICADVFNGDDPILSPSMLYRTGDDLTIGFFGMETPETQTKVNPGLIQGIRFLSKGDLYTCAQEQIDELREEGADIVIALTHLGVDAESAPDGHRSIDLYHNTTGIDLILDGHSHTVMTEGENGEPIQSTGTKFENIGVVVIDDATKTIEDHYLLPTKVTETVVEDGQEVEKVVSEMDKDPEVAALAQEIIDRVDAEYGEVFAQSEILLNGERAPGNRTEETNLGDLITDAIVWKVLEVNREGDRPATLTVGDTTVDEDHIVGITNGGGIRASIQPGDVTRKDLNTVLPFGNTVSVVFVTGAELLEALEASTYATPDALGGYPQTFGIEFTLDTTKPYAQGDAYPESTYYSPASIQRVTITKINGEPFDLTATYAVVTNNFCAAGGDTYYVFKNASAQFDTGIVMDEAVMDYVHDALGGVISRETYETPRGDQTIILSQSYSVSVTGGSGSGNYAEGASVTITAGAPESGRRFKEWTWTGGEALNFTSGSATTATAVFAMPAHAVSLTATYEETGGTASQVQARFHFSPSITGGQADAPCTFDPSWFFQSARSNYQSGLAQLSIRTAMAAFGTDAVLETDASAEQVRYLSEEAPYSTSANIVRLMQDLGFSKITADYQNPGLDTIGYAIANREISNGDGETARLILIAVRGGGYRQEWASNFTIGLSKEHQGFSEAASMVFRTAQAYLSELRADGYNGAVKFWITGYSRGAAVANLTAQRLTALADSDSGFTRGDVFAYCFACPRNVVLDSADGAAYDNIANIVHYADFVPKIPLAPWGYGRYGKTYYLPAPELTAQYSDALGKMAQSLGAFFGAMQPTQDATVTQQSVWALTRLLPNQGRLTDRFTDTMAVHVGSQAAFVDMVQGAFRDVIAATGGVDGFGAFFQVLTGLPDYYERYEKSILPIVENGTQISLAHAPELYLAWLDALERVDGRSRVLVVNGTANVTVFDGNGAVAAQITGDEASDSVLPAYVDPDGQKIVPLPLDGAFRVELTYDADTLVSYQIEETDLETGITDRLTRYDGILLEAGGRLTGTVDALAAGVRGEYPLRSAEGVALTPDADIVGAVRNCKVSIYVRGSGSDGGESPRNGSAQGGGLYVPGEYAQALAIPAGNAAFLGWYENGELISTDAQFRFSVTADRELTAVFSSETTAYQVSVQGGSGSGTYQQGESVSISANNAPEGQVFDKWLGADGLNFISGNQNSASATFTMPDKAVRLTATFRAQGGESGQSGGGCYVATAVYGSYDCPEVWTLRRFRDDVLAETWYGRLFIHCYYAVSPTAVKLFGDCEWFQQFFRDRLDKMVSDLQADGFESTPYQDSEW